LNVILKSPPDIACLMLGSPQDHNYIKASEWQVKIALVWQHHPRSTPIKSRPVYTHQNILYCVRNNAAFSWIRPRDEFASLIEDYPRYSITEFGQSKPAELLEELISCMPQIKTLCDPFAGAGTTMISAELSGRQSYNIELNPLFCAVALSRFSDEYPKAKIEVVV